MTPLPLAVTMGEPAGIGGELSLKAWCAGSGNARPFYVIDDPARLRALDVALGLGVRVIPIADPAEARAAFADGLPVLTESLAVEQRPGQPEPRNAAAAIRAIERAVAHVREDRAAAVVTNPIDKKALHDGAGFAFPGHTEFLGYLAGGACTVMMLASPVLRVVPVTVHVALRAACEALGTDLIVETGRIADAALRRDFGIAAPRLAVSGLNPHAGEGGTMGHEEIEIIAPAVEALRAAGVNAFGPLPADTMFHEAARARYDAALCMTHDQALIPLKALDFARGVNVTLGLPFIRTSPDHGTAYDIAGTGKADVTSLVEAMRMADAMASARD